jgi:hypothetical protein
VVFSLLVITVFLNSGNCDYQKKGAGGVKKWDAGGLLNLTFLNLYLCLYSIYNKMSALFLI